jgi:hypothetical protein
VACCINSGNRLMIYIFTMLLRYWPDFYGECG